jgi:hypothetical protein
LPREGIPECLAALEHTRTLLWARLLAPGPTPSHDRLLPIEEAAARLATTKDWLRRHHDLPFVVHLSEGQVRYSEQGIERFIRRRQRA